MWADTINNTRPVRDVFKDFSALEGELEDEQAKATLAEFLFHNPRMLMRMLGGIQMYPMQELIMKGWAANDYNLGVWGRGVSKSFCVAMFALYWAMFNPGQRIVIASFSFRQSRAILDLCVKMINEEGAEKLHSCFPEPMRRGTDEWKLEVPGGAVVRCLPLGDGKKIRGVRADTLIIDEFAFLPENIIGEILRPFLASNNRIKEQRAIDEREDEMVRRGEIDDDDRTILEDRKKVIFLSSACYTFEHLYKRYENWTKLLTLDRRVNPKEYDAFKKSGTSYFISRISWEAAPKGLLNLNEIEQARNESSESMFNREYGAQFTSDSDGYYRMSKMIACSVPNGESPTLEVRGEAGAEYILGIDQNASGSESSDHFAMCLMKIITRTTDGKRFGRVVHSYAVAGNGLSDHMLYLYYLMRNFNIVYVALDATQGDEVEFVNSCNQSKLFKDANIQLLAIDADFKRDDFRELPTEIKKSYNRTAGRIVQKQPFGSSFQRAANEYMQSCFDHKNISFGAKICANSDVAASLATLDISLLSGHAEFSDMSVMQFIEFQDNLLDLMRNECAMIQVKTTDQGSLSYGLPQSARRTTGPNKIRKDSYSALLVCNWGLKLYVESQNVQVQQGPPDLHYGFVG